MNSRLNEPKAEKSMILSITALLSLVMMAMSGCGTSNYETDSMKSKQDKKASGDMQSDPGFYKLNSVVGEVKSGGKAVPGATVTIVATGESLPVEAGGFYILVLDPAKLGKRPKELLFAAPGYAEQRHSVLVPENKQVRLDVELVPAK
jgi:hypothetical protein